jgi:hypothetical protein
MRDENGSNAALAGDTSVAVQREALVHRGRRRRERIPPPPGDLAALATLPPDTPLFKAAMAKLFGVSERTLQRWVQDDLIPPPTGLGRRKYWVAGAVLRHMLERAEREAALAKRRSRGRR